MKLIINNLCKKYDKKIVLQDASFEFETGKIYALLGRNGAGKTTFFNCLNEDCPYESGEFYLDDERRKIKLDENNVGYVLSTPVVPEFLTAREFLKFFIDINRESINNLLTIDEYFDIVNISIEDRDLLLKDYSHGMKNKVQMLANLILSPKVLLLDEPLTSFDVVVAMEMEQMLQNIKKDHIIIFSTHIMELATNLCDEIVLLSNHSLSSVSKADLNEHELKEKIVALLKDDINEK